MHNSEYMRCLSKVTFLSINTELGCGGGQDKIGMSLCRPVLSPMVGYFVTGQRVLAYLTYIFHPEVV